jgi:hypothetical protein
LLTASWIVTVLPPYNQDVCVKNNGDVILRDRIDNNDNGFNRLLSKLSEKDIDLSGLKVAIESPHHRLIVVQQSSI